MSSGEIKPPRSYLSHSQFYLFKNDPEEYFRQYYVAKLDRRTKKMHKGKVFQEAWCDPKYKYGPILRKAGFTPDVERAIKTALEHPDTIRVEKRFTEVKLRAKGMGLNCTILGILDGFKKADKLLLENKFGVVWTEDRVAKEVQLTWYMLIVYIKYGFIPKTILQSFNANNGIPTLIKVKRTIADFKELIEDINSVWARIIIGDYNQY